MGPDHSRVVGPNTFTDKAMFSLALIREAHEVKRLKRLKRLNSVPLATIRRYAKGLGAEAHFFVGRR